MAEVISGSQDGVSFWDAKTFALKKRAEPFSGSHVAPSSLSWGTNNQRLLIVPHDGEKIALTEVQEQSPPMWKYLVHKDGVNFRCGCFMGNSRYVVAGCTSPQVHLWDTQTQDIVNTYQGHTTPISAVARSLKDNHIVSGADNGQILLHATTSTQLLANLTKDHRDKDSSSKQAITRLTFSHHDRALIGSSGEDGSVCLWSTESQRLLTRFSQKHAGPATDVCFSPYNKLLMVSAGIDSKMTCYDIQQRRSVTQISAPAALSSVAVLRDGMTLVGGGTDGKLYVYELRNVKVPSQVIEAHRSAVTCISEQLPLKSTASKPVSKDSGAQITSEAQKQDQEPSELSSEGLVVHTPFIPPSYLNRLASKGDPPYLPKMALQTPIVRDNKMGPFVTPAFNAATPGIFSPLENDAGMLQTNKAAVSMGPASRDSMPVSSTYPDVSSIFSPLVTVSTEAQRGPPSSAMQSIRPLLIPRVTTVGASTVPLVPLSSTTRPLVPVTTSMNQASSAPSQDFPTSTSLTETPLAASLVQSSIQTAVSSAAAVESFASQRVDSRAECQEESHDAMLITEPNFSNDQPLPLTSSLTRPAPTFQHADAPAIQVQYLEGLIKDTAEELRYTMHRDIRALSLDMFRQFFIQQQQLAATVSSLSEKLDRLSTENQRIQEQLQQFMPRH